MNQSVASTLGSSIEINLFCSSASLKRLCCIKTRSARESYALIESLSGHCPKLRSCPSATQQLLFDLKCYYV